MHHIIGSTSTPSIVLDYSVDLPTGGKLAFELLEDNNKDIPIGIKFDSSVDNEITLTFDEADASKKGEYKMRIKATLG